jgi:type IV pilus assembly protein PilB
MANKAASIEDLLKKAAAPAGAAAAPVQAAAAPGGTGTAGGAKVKPKTARKELSTEQKLEEKMEQIRVANLEKITQAEAAKYGIPYVNLVGFPIAPEALALIPRAEANKLKLVAFLLLGEEMRLATMNPTPEVKSAVERIAKEQGAHAELYLISEVSFKAAEKIYDALPEVKEVIYGYRIEQADLERYAKEISNFKDLQQKITEVSTSDIVVLMMGAALKSGASDIHVEAEEEDVKIRFRIDGLLQEAAKLPRDAWKQMISRLKLLAGVKINVEDVPQDGRITIYLQDEKVDIRVSFLPTAFGESVVMRLLRPKAIALDFDNLGVRGKALKDLTREIERPNGMIVTTGPTGSGKTTTLYAILKKLNTSDIKIITLEDPVEYKLEGINQSQIQHEKGYDFAKGLRAILRQDPDVVMVGEIRDLETAEIAIQAALTGHLVVSTIHTNSAAGAVPRFMSMGVKPFLLAPAINCIIGQRLVRRLCEKCKQPAELEPAILAEVKNELKTITKASGYSVDLAKLKFSAPPPDPNTCTTCNGLGYKGRLGIYEIFSMTKEIENLILSGNVSEYQMAEMAQKQGMITMAQDGLLKALDGLTSVEEVLRAAEIEAVAEDIPEQEK